MITGLPPKAETALKEFCGDVGVDLHMWEEDAPAVLLEDTDDLLYDGNPTYEWSADAEHGMQLYTNIQMLVDDEWYVVDFQITGD